MLKPGDLIAARTTETPLYYNEDCLDEVGREYKYAQPLDIIVLLAYRKRYVENDAILVLMNSRLYWTLPAWFKNV